MEEKDRAAKASLKKIEASLTERVAHHKGRQAPGAEQNGERCCAKQTWR